VTSCGSAISCGTNGATYEECETTKNGACEEIYYYASTGVEYVCNSCSDCSAASSNMSSYCSSQTTTTSCSSLGSCGSNGATYEECETTTGGVCSSIFYYASTGAEYACNSCSDCSAAYSNITSYCSSQSTTTSCSSLGSCGSNGATYEECETTTGGVCSSIYYYASTGAEYVCNSCSDCSAAYSEIQSYCSSQTTTSSTCGTATSCGSHGATYNWCEDLSNGSCTYIYYYTSTGQEYACSSCSDCSAAYSEVSSYCSTQ
jgi:hypothetical protein